MQCVLLLEVSDSHIGGSICEQKPRTLGLHNPPCISAPAFHLQNV